MNKESRLLIEIWDVVGEQINKSQRVDAVINILRAFEDYGIDPLDFEEATDEDPYIANGFEAVVEREDSYDDEDEEDI